MKRRIGIYAGTFDPVHAGHVAFARQALEECNLSEVVFLPDRSPWRKEEVTDFAHRVALLECALADAVAMRVMELESWRFTPRAVLPELEKLFGNSELVLLMGSDVARTLPIWDSIELLLAEVSLVVGIRGDDASDNVDAVMRKIVQQFGAVDYKIIRADNAEVASTKVRGGDYSHLHPDVSAYIKRNGLYAKAT